jgi:hypothetical protein
LGTIYQRGGPIDRRNLGTLRGIKQGSVPRLALAELPFPSLEAPSGMARGTIGVQKYCVVRTVVYVRELIFWGVC